jgi:NADPH:quinone reductase-like Zn-dependent oxidoreductase
MTASSRTCPSDTLAPISETLDFEHATAPSLAVTAGAQLIERGVKPRQRQTVLVTGALGSVGRSAVPVVPSTERG